MKLVIFDMDGTIVDTWDTITHYMNYALESLKLATVNRDDIKKFAGDGRRKLIERCIKAVGAESSYTDKVEEIYSSAYIKNPLYLSKPCTGLLKDKPDNTTLDVIIKKLKEMGVKTAIVSNKPHELTVKIAEALFGDSVDEVRGASEGVALKPNPVQILEIMEKFGVDKDECIYVGDMDIDIKTAKNAGICSIGVLWGCHDWDRFVFAGADIITHRPYEIIKAASVPNVKDLKNPEYIPSYWKNHLEEKINKIKENQLKAGENSMSFGLISDIHWCKQRTSYSGAILKKVADECNIPYILNGGDTVSGAGTCKPERLFEEFSGYSKEFEALEEKILMALGNHDSAYSEFEPPRYYAQNITKKEIFDYVFKYETKYPDRIMSDDGFYFYVDCKPSKTRFVIMNPFDVPNDDVNEDGSAKYNRMRLSGYRQAQLKWFADRALNVPSQEWTVVLCTHLNPASKEYCRNEDAVLNIIKAFREKTSYSINTTYEDIPDYNAELSGDFKKKGGNFAIWLSGHTHYDNTVVFENTLCTSIISDWNHQADNIPFIRYAGSVMEHAFDIYTIDTKNHKLYVVRIGAGYDREFDYL